MGLGSGIPDPGPGVKKAPDPGSGSATMKKCFCSDVLLCSGLTSNFVEDDGREGLVLTGIHSVHGVPQFTHLHNISCNYGTVLPVLLSYE